MVFTTTSSQLAKAADLVVVMEEQKGVYRRSYVRHTVGESLYQVYLHGS